MKEKMAMILAAFALFASVALIVATETDAATEDLTEITEADLEMIVYDDDGVTPLFKYIVSADYTLSLDNVWMGEIGNIKVKVVEGDYKSSTVTKGDLVDKQMYVLWLDKNHTDFDLYVQVSMEITFANDDKDTVFVKCTPYAKINFEDWSKYIEPKDIELTYNGKEQTPEIKVIKNGQEYPVSISGETSATDVRRDSFENALGEIQPYKVTVTLVGEQYEYFPTCDVDWKIVPKELSAAFVKLQPDKFVNDEKDHVPTVVVTDTDRGVKLIKATLDPITGKAFIVKGDYVSNEVPKSETGKYRVTVMGVGNYTGVVSKSWSIIEPIVLDGELHVNVIDYCGSIDKFTFEDMIYIFPQEAYEGYGDAIPSSAYFITVKDGWGQLVFTDNPDEMAKAEEAGVAPTGVTSSQWNWIRIDGNRDNGYDGTIFGYFYVDFNPVYRVGSEFSSNGIVYSVTSVNKSTVSVVGYKDGITDVVIPDVINGYKVTKIADKAFYGCTTITSLVIGDNVTSIGMKAFANCFNIKTIEFGDSVKVISYYAFYKCTGLTEVVFDDSLTTVRSNAFGGITFKDASGKALDKTAANLAGHTFEGSKKVLKLVA